jgi:signal transduction histidine kinase
MAWQYTLYIVAAFLAAATTGALALYAWRQRPAPGTGAFAIFMALATWLSLASALSMLGNTAAVAYFWFKALFISLAGMPVAWLVFAIQYTKRHVTLTPLRLLALSAIPLITQGIVWTNGFHHWFFQSPDIFQRVAGFMIADRNAAVLGPWFWIYSGYGYLLIAISVVFIVRAAIRAFRLYLGQALALLAGAVFPLATTIINTLGLFPRIKVFLAPLGFAMGGIAFAWAMFHYRLFDVVPVARDMLIDNMSDGMIALDAQNRVVDLNATFQAIIDTPPHQAIGRSVTEVLRPWPSLLEALNGASNVKAEVSLNAHSYDLHCSSLTNREGQVNGRLILLHDITARKQAEEALRQHTQALEAQNAELDAFAHTVAHDLKSPLTVMVGYSMLLERRFEALPPDIVRAKLHLMSLSGQKMTSIIDELLLLAGIRKMDEVDIGPLDMASIVAEAQQRLEPLVAQHRVTFVAPETWPEAMGYAPWVEEVWVNYISNAIKYGGRPNMNISPRVEVGFDRYPLSSLTPEGADANSAYIRFWVKDNGMGLSKDEQAQLFMPFKRLAKVGVGGHGLGLSIVQRIVHKLGGEVGVESESGQGSTFWFTLPTCGDIVKDSLNVTRSTLETLVLNKSRNILH